MRVALPRMPALRGWLAAALLGLMALAGALPAVAEGGRVPLPAIPKAKGEQCVADTGFMRRNHMKMLGHQRDETVHEGIRSPKFALKGCVDCHATQGADGKAITVADPRHFCRACHDYAAVKVDCFECHASRPEPGKSAAGPLLDGHETAHLADYLKGIAR